MQEEIHQASPGVPGEPEQSDHFGISVASYDRDRDGCGDLVVGTPGESLGDTSSAGTVTVIPGSPSGLNTQAALVLHQNTLGVPGAAQHADTFGSALTAGHTRSGEPYLVIGAPGESIGEDPSQGHGAVHYLRGAVNVMVHQNTPGIPGGNEALDSFGETVVATRDHIVISTPEEDLVVDGKNREDAGAIHVLSHTFDTSGSPEWARMLHQNTAGISGTSEFDDAFGGGKVGVTGEGGMSAVAFRPGGVSDSDAGSLIAVGVPGEDLGPIEDHIGDGMVHLLYVSRAGSVSQLRAIHQDTAGVTGSAEPKDRFGDELLLFGNRGDEAVTPGVTKLLVAATDERVGDQAGAYQLFSLAGAPGDGDIWISHGHFGLSYPGSAIGPNLGVTETDLYLEGPRWWEVTVVPWANILDGASVPVRRIRAGGEGANGLFGRAMT